MNTHNQANIQYDCVIVGAGIVGAGIFRDLVLNGVNTLLIDKGDFSSQTSQSSSKMLHGGIRYLENMDFKLVFEALKEKNLWLKIAPHIAKEMPFYLPVYKDSKRPFWMIHAGLFLYDSLSLYQNTKFQIFRKSSVLKHIPLLNPIGLRGTGKYFDGIMDDSKLTLEVILDVKKEKNANIQNYCEFIEVENFDNYSELTLKNLITNELQKITTKFLVFALGPFTDQVLKNIPDYNWKNVLLPSKGSHIWISKKILPLNEALVMTPDDENGDRVIFIVPHEHRVLIGTTEVKTNENFENIKASEEEIDYLLKNLNLYFPKLNITKEHILASFSGIRPLLKEDSNSDDRGKTSREHKIYRPLKNTFVIAGGKYTTFRVMGQEITKNITSFLKKSYNEDLTLNPLRYKSVINSFSWHIPSDHELELILENEEVKTFNDLVHRRLSMPSKKSWNDVADIDFDTYFNSKITILSNFLNISEEDLKNEIKNFN